MQSFFHKRIKSLLIEKKLGDNKKQSYNYERDCPRRPVRIVGIKIVEQKPAPAAEAEKAEPADTTFKK